MKKGSKLMFAYSSTLIMLVGFFLPNFTYIVNATEVDANDNLLKGEEVTFSNVTDGVLNLDMEENKSAELNISSDEYEIINCFSTDYINMLTSTVENDGKTCSVLANNYGKTDLVITYRNKAAISEYDVITKVISVDIDFQKYFNFFLDSIPEELEYYDYYYYDLPYDLEMPSTFEIEPDEESCWNVIGETCTLKLIYHYYKYNGAEYDEATYTGTKDSILVDKNEDNDYFLDSGFLQLGIGEERDFDIYPSYNINEYFWVSSDNTVAKVNDSNKVVGVAPGTAEVRLVHRETLEVKVDYLIEVDSIYATREMDKVLDVFKDTVVIDISNDLGYFRSNTFDTTQPIIDYFEKLTTNINNVSFSNITCGDGLKDCRIDYRYSYDESDLSTQYFDVQYQGVYVGYVMGTHSGYDDVSFVFLDSEVTLDDIISTDEANTRVSYDTEMLERVGDTGYVFKTLKEGFTTITLYIENESGSGYMTNINLYILFTEDDVNSAYETLYNLNEIVIPYSPEGMSKKTMNDLFRGLIEDSLLDNPVYPYLEIEVSSLPDHNFLLNTWVEVNGRVLGIVSITDKAVNGLFDPEGEVIYNEVEEILSKVNDNYKLSTVQSIKLVNSSNSSEEFYSGILGLVGLDSLESDKFELRFYQIRDYAYNDYLLAGSDFSLEIYYEGQFVARKDFFVGYDFVLHRDITENSTPASKLTYVKNYISGLGIDATVTSDFDNYYLVENDNISLYLLLDQKDKVVAQDVAFYVDNTDLKVGETKKIKYALRPFGATYADITFKSSNERVVKVDNNGVMTGVSKGFAFVRMSYQGNYEDIFVTVGYTDNSFFDEMVSGLDLDFDIPYSLLNAYDGDTASAIYYVASDEIDIFMSKLKEGLNESAVSAYGLNPGHISYDFVTKEGGPEDEFYLVLSTGNHTSNYYPIKYKFIGINPGDTVYDVGLNKTLDAKIKYSEGKISDLRYSYSNPGIISIKDGIITGLKVGKTRVRVYDKYNRYENSFTVYVDEEQYIEVEANKLNSTVIKLSSKDLNGHSIYDMNDLGSLVISYLIDNEIDYDAVLGTYDFMQYAFDEETMKFTINAHSYELGLVNQIVLQLKIDAIYIERPNVIFKLPLNIPYTQVISKYGNLVDATVTAKSSDTSICTVDGLTVTGKKAGICKITYTANNDSIVQYFNVEPEGIVNELNNLLELVPDTIEIKADEFDPENNTSNPDYYDIYESYIDRYLEKTYKDYEYLYYEIPYSINENDEFEFQLLYSYPYEFYNVTIFDDDYMTDSKLVKISYTGSSDNADEMAEEIIANIKEEYFVDIDDYFEFLLSDDYFIWSYSDMMSDIKKVCSDCEVYLNGFGGNDPINGKARTEGAFILYKNDEPIGTFNASFTSYIQLDLYEVEYDGHIEDEVIKVIRKAYNNYLLNQNIVAFNNVDSNDDVEITVSRGAESIYLVTIDDQMIFPYVYVNIIKRVEEIKVNKDILNLEVGDTEKISATISPSDAYNKNVKWSSSNQKVVTVKDGKVTAIGAGNAIITVESEDGYAKATINVSVIDPKVIGDIDGDGKVNIVDLVQLRKHLAGITTLKGDALSGADVNKDGKVNILDLVKIRKHLAGLEVIK